ncbi:MAG: phosphoglucosamine mutase [Promethearchaeota archaeon]|nr:MAG: phosphoglucosamine mutase [Candidatus Lokiarchaeota archaeon]
MSRTIFGTSGIRRIFSNYDNTDVMLTPQMALEVGLALGTYLNGDATVVIGKDIRTSALPIEYAFISGLVSTGCIVKTLGIVTTPTLAMSLRYLGADCGVVITASHNTPEYIGLKFWNPTGMGYIEEQEEEIEKIYTDKAFLNIEWDGVGTVSHINDINDAHIAQITHQIKFDGHNLHAIVDPGNGAGCTIVPQLLSEYDVNLMTINAQMDGKFPGRNSEPSKENLVQIAKFLRTSDTDDIGIALDGDADRVIFLDENGTIVDPIRLLALMAVECLKRNKDQISDENMKVATPINSSSLIEDVLNPLGCEIIRTEVGDIKVAQALEEQGGFLGGETSGTYIWPESHLGPDSIFTIANVLKMISESNMSLRELLDDIPEYPYYRDAFKLKEDIPFTEEINNKIIDEMKEILNSEGKEIKNINKMDGVRIDYNDGWILIRRSGTSPYLRISGESTENLEASKRMNKMAEEKMLKLGLI